MIVFILIDFCLYPVVGQHRLEFVDFQILRKEIIAMDFLIEAATVVRLAIHFGLNAQHTILQRDFKPKKMD